MIEGPNGKSARWSVVPVRFVQGCPNGHISDIDWRKVVHDDGTACGGDLWLDERGTTGDVTELYVRCALCENELPLVRLQGGAKQSSLLGFCQGDRLWLGPVARETCGGDGGKPQGNRLLIRHASNAYFPVVERAISIPDAQAELRRAVDAV